MAAKTILMPIGDFGEDYEIMVPFQALLADLHLAAAFPVSNNGTKQALMQSR